MEMPYLAFLIVYLIVVGIFMIMAFFNLYHIFKFGMFDMRAKIIAILFLLISAAIIALTLYFLKEMDWSDSLSMFSVSSI